MRYAYFDGAFVDDRLAVVSIRTHAFNYGTAAFEGVKAFHLGHANAWSLFRPRDHYRRLRNSAAILGFDLPVAEDEFLDILARLLRRNGIQSDTYLRPLVFADRLGVGLAKRSGCGFAVYVEPAPPTPFRRLTACMAKTTRTPSISIPSAGKFTGAYINSYLAQREAIRRGYDVALLKNINGHISEAFGMTIFTARDGRLFTPPCRDDILEGVTRRTLISLADKHLQVATVQDHIKPGFLLSADEVFVCGTGSAVNAVVSIDGHLIGDGSPGRLTTRLRELYLDAATGKLPESATWCLPVPAK